MGPKAKPAPVTTLSTEEWQQELMDKISGLAEKLESIENTLRAVTKEKETLSAKVEEQAWEILELKNSLNDREQYARSWSMRCLNIPVPSDKETNTRIVMQCVYDSLLSPILEGAKAAGTIPSVPGCEELLETAHILPGKAGHKPSICRFFSRYWRNLVFRNRKAFAPKETGRQGRMRYPFFEDLTKANFKMLAGLKLQEDVVAAWTVNGSIRFRVKDNDKVFRVSSINETMEDIVNSE